jgi:cation transport ATPase
VRCVLTAQAEGQTITMAGEGVNAASALTRADVVVAASLLGMTLPITLVRILRAKRLRIRRGRE